MTGFNLQKLQSGILGLSNSDNWQAAKLEWELDYIFESGSAEVCLCGHHPIRKLCVLKNTENGNDTIVGNFCVKKFMDNDKPEKIYNCFKRIQSDNTKPLNIESIEYANNKNWITEWEYGFLKTTSSKRYTTLTEKQKFKRVEVNTSVVNHIVAAVRPNIPN